MRKGVANPSRTKMRVPSSRILLITCVVILASLASIATIRSWTLRVHEVDIDVSNSNTFASEDDVRIEIERVYAVKDGFGAVVELTIDNGSAKNLSFWYRMAVNSCMVDAVEITHTDRDWIAKAHNVSHVSIGVFDEDLKLNNITSIDTITLVAEAYDASEYSRFAEFDTLSITVKNASSHSPVESRGGKMVVDSEDVQIAILGWQTPTNDIFLFNKMTRKTHKSPSLLIEVINNSEDTISVTAEDVSIDNYMVESLFYPELLPHTRYLGYLELGINDSTNDSLDGFKTMELRFVAYSYRDNGTEETIAESSVVSVSR